MYQKYLKVLSVTLLVILLTNCGPSSSTPSTHTNINGTNTTTSSPQGSVIAFNIAGLHIQSDYGIQCYNHEAWIAGKERANLVLADNHRLKYDGPELEQMMKYVTAYYTGSLYTTGEPHPALPSTLSYKLGGNKLFLSNLGWIGCFEEIALSNVGDHPIQLQSIDVRFTASPQPNNNEQYSLIDVCSLLLSPVKEGGCPGGKGGGGIDYYYYQLSAANADHIFSPQFLDRDNYPPPGNLKSTTFVLNPSDKEVINLLFDSSPSSIIYSIIPELIIGTSNGRQSIAMPQLAGKLYFANMSQFSCYTLQGNTFVKETDLSGSWVGSKGMCI